MAGGAGGRGSWHGLTDNRDQDSSALCLSFLKVKP